MSKLSFTCTRRVLDAARSMAVRNELSKEHCTVHHVPTKRGDALIILAKTPLAPKSSPTFD